MCTHPAVFSRQLHLQALQFPQGKIRRSFKKYYFAFLGTKLRKSRLEAAEMRFLRSVKGYTRLDKIRSEVIRNELETSRIQDVRSEHKQNWIIHLERMDNTRLPKHALNYKPRGRRVGGRPRKRWERVDTRTGQST